MLSYCSIYCVFYLIKDILGCRGAVGAVGAVGASGLAAPHKA